MNTSLLLFDNCVRFNVARNKKTLGTEPKTNAARPYEYFNSNQARLLYANGSAIGATIATSVLLAVQGTVPYELGTLTNRLKYVVWLFIQGVCQTSLYMQ